MATDIDTILQLKVPVIVSIGNRSIPVDEVLALGPGSIIELVKPSDEELEVQVNNKPVGTGTAVKVGENFGLRINYIGSPRERAEAVANG